MNTIEDLRTTLASHAEQSDAPVVARTRAIRARIRQVRMRRRAAAAAVVAAAVATVGLAVLMPNPERVPVAGLPEEVKALHFTYELADTEALEIGAGREQIKVPLPGGDGYWGVVVRGNGLETGAATVFINGEPVLRIRGDERSALYPIPFHAGGHITVKVDDAADDGEVSLGIYERTGAVAGDALSYAGRMFPATFGGARLIGGEFGDPDDTVVRYWFRATGRPITVAPVCLDPTGTFQVRYQLDGRDVGGGDCSDESLDPSMPDLAISNQWQPGELSPGRHTVTLVATRRDGSTGPPEGFAVLMGIAVYEEGEQVHLGATDIDKVTEQNGRRWQVDRVIPISKSRAFSTEVATGDRPALVGFQTCGRTVTAYARAQSSGRRTDDSTSMDSTGGCGYTVGDELLAYDTYDVTLETSKDDLAKGDESFDGALVVYRPVD
ncbi:hypothetical protein [Nocardioides panzhihuensis]|uniref:Uncharacterized protein n=1 Tax=Nocardioides panzhihuensis TaxID=860243 RepID=A0A7Z0DRV2_9ACTN|nr:hypothetical protein [Nocardioides panzhihuensis]NYI80520.1 hypothetical protein [Nocardioides panzhihuensis]